MRTGMGHSWLKWVLHYDLDGWGSYGKLSYYLWKIYSKNTGLQGSTPSSHHMTTGFSSFELPTCGLLQKGRDNHSQLAFRSPALGWHSQCYEY